MPISPQPDYVATLQEVFSESKVFFEELKDVDTLTLDKAALDWYRHVTSEMEPTIEEDESESEHQERLGMIRAGWMAAWQQAYVRPQEGDTGIMAALNELEESPFAADTNIWAILDVIGEDENTQSALSAAFDDPTVAQLTCYSVGDGGAYSGLMIAALRTNGEATFLVFLFE